jgi:hypothetical protein
MTRKEMIETLKEAAEVFYTVDDDWDLGGRLEAVIEALEKEDKEREKGDNLLKALKAFCE